MLGKKMGKGSISIGLLLGKGKPKHDEEDEGMMGMDDEADEEKSSDVSDDEEMFAEELVSALGLSNADSKQVAEALSGFVKACMKSDKY